MSLQQNVVEPLDASFTELTQATDDTPILLSCGICNKRYKTRSSLRWHINMHNAEHICRICSSVFKTEAEYLEHKSRKHSVPYLCSTCGKSFTRHSSLIEHNKQHSDKKETCPFEKCGKTFIRKQLLADHINSHTGVKPYSCDKCKKTFDSQSSYSHHKSNCMKRIKCEECGDVFSTKSVLYDHVKSKHEVQWFVCNCGKHYRWRTNLAKHRKNCLV